MSPDEERVNSSRMWIVRHRTPRPRLNFRRQSIKARGRSTGKLTSYAGFSSNSAPATVELAYENLCALHPRRRSDFESAVSQNHSASRLM